MLGSNVRVLAGADLERSVVHDNAYIGPGARIRGTIVGRATNLRANVRCEEGVVLGDEVFVGSNAVLSNDVKVYPFKTVEDGAIVNSSIIWESRGARSLFGRTGVSGLANVDITPELAAKVAMAYGTSLPQGHHRRHVAGLEPVGAHAEAGHDGRPQLGRRRTCFDLEVASMPVTRFLVRSPRVFGGISVRLRLDDPESVVVRFFDGTGADISEDAQAQDRAAVPAGGLPPGPARGDRRHPVPTPGARGLHRGPGGHVDIAAIVARRFKLVVDHGYGATSFVMPNVLAKLGADVLSVNPFASTSGIMRFDRDGACERVVRPGRGVGRAPRGGVRPRRRAPVPHRRPRRRPRPTTSPCWRSSNLVCGHLLGDRIALPVTATAHAGRLAAQHGVSVRETKVSAAALMPTPPPNPGSASPPTARAASSSPGSCLPSMPPPPS